MNKTQQNILWLGLIIVGVFLFTDQTFRNKLFNRGAQKTSVNNQIPFTLTDIFTGIPKGTSKSGHVKVGMV
jgi:hypothetical protein